MGTDDLFKKRRGEKKKRSENIRRIAPYRYLIVCEGEETEPNYFRGIKDRIEKVYKDKIDVKSKIELDIKGTGRNTEDLVDFAIMIRSLSAIPYGHVWVVFDKDDFSDEQFNNSIVKAKQNGINVDIKQLLLSFCYLQFLPRRSLLIHFTQNFLHPHILVIYPYCYLNFSLILILISLSSSDSFLFNSSSTLIFIFTFPSLIA
ncbi:MAG: RloB domain-containing protein [Clostridiaceae bacterium]|nr:RloB domain-containing protein [Clostridiaceae bacterium]